MCEDITLLDEIKATTKEMINETLDLKEKMLRFQGEIESEVNTVLEKTPLLITHSQRLPTNLDSEDIESYQLPPPIIPQVNYYLNNIFDPFTMTKLILIVSFRFVLLPLTIPPIRMI